MKLSLYNIQTEFLQLAGELIENGGELTPELQKSLEINKDNLETKGTNYGLVIKQLDADCGVIDAELARLSALKKQRLKTIERLENAISVAMELYEIEKLETPILKISFRKSETVEIEDMALLDKDYKKISIPVESADKAKIKEAIKNGQTVIGATIKQHKNIQIK